MFLSLKQNLKLFRHRKYLLTNKQKNGCWKVLSPIKSYMTYMLYYKFILKFKRISTSFLNIILPLPKNSIIEKKEVISFLVALRTFQYSLIYKYNLHSWIYLLSNVSYKLQIAYGTFCGHPSKFRASSSLLNFDNLVRTSALKPCWLVL